MLWFRCVPLKFLHSRHGPLTQLWRVSAIPGLLVHEMQVEWQIELCVTGLYRVTHLLATC